MKIDGGTDIQSQIYGLMRDYNENIMRNKIGKNMRKVQMD